MFLVASLPADVVWHKAVAHQLNGQNIPVKVLSMQGTVWNGKALVKYQNIESIVEWEVSISGLVSLALPVKLSIESQAGLIQMNASLGLNSSFIELASADIDLAYVTPLL